MKKLMLALVAAFALAGIPLAASAAPLFTIINGTITNNGKVVNNAKVTVICNGKVQKTTSDNTGFYSVSFQASKCKPGSSVSVTATKGGKGGENNGTVGNFSADLNVALVNVALPEFGMITGIGAAFVGGGAFLLIRRRDLGANPQ